MGVLVQGHGNDGRPRPPELGELDVEDIPHLNQGNAEVGVANGLVEAVYGPELREGNLGPQPPGQVPDGDPLGLEVEVRVLQPHGHHVQDVALDPQELRLPERGAADGEGLYVRHRDGHVRPQGPVVQDLVGDELVAEVHKAGGGEAREEGKRPLTPDGPEDPPEVPGGDHQPPPEDYWGVGELRWVEGLQPELLDHPGVVLDGPRRPGSYLGHDPETPFPL